LNLSLFLSTRISSPQYRGFSGLINRIAIITIALGLAAAIVSFLIMYGFQDTVKDKIYGVSGHLLITRFTMSNAAEEQPFSYNLDVVRNPEQYPSVAHVQEFAHKPGLIKAEDEVLGILFRGIGRSFSQERFQPYMKAGRFIQLQDSSYSREVVVSSEIARKLNIELNDEITIHFFQNPPRFRKLQVVGLYETNLSEYFDGQMVMGDIRLVQRLNDWGDSVAGGLQIYLKNPQAADAAMVEIGERMDYDFYLEKTSDRYNMVFDWLGLISRQVNILLAIILSVVCVNMISVILILVMERTQMIGMLKALGAKNRLVRSVFIYQGMQLIGKGLLWGNVVGLGLCWLQWKFQILKLSANDYYMSYVPISWHWWPIVVLNLLVFTLVTVVLLVPTGLTTRIQPIRAIRFD
jgi:lipoprotein-releasing system permease protein